MGKPSGHASPATVVAVVMTFTFIAACCVFLRLWTRFRITRQAGWDDAVVTLSLIFTTIFAACIMKQVHYGLGRHESTLTPHEQTHLLIWFWISIWNYYLGLGLAKLSIVLQCLRLFGQIAKFRRCAIALGTTIFLFMLWTVCISINLCQPVSHFWQPQKDGKCLTRLPVWFFNSSFNICTDIATAILPIPVVKTLNLPKRQRRMLMGVFALGGVICLVSIIRLHSLYAIAVSDDPSWDNPLAALWALLEASVGIIASCLPTLKGLVGKLFPTLFATTSGTRGDATPGTPGTELISGMRKSAVTVSVERGRSWNPLPAQEKPPKILKRFGKVRLKESPRSAGQDSVEVEHVELKGDGIQVTTVVEQVERRKNEWDCESREQLVPMSPHKRP